MFEHGDGAATAPSQDAATVEDGSAQLELGDAKDKLAQQDENLNEMSEREDGMLMGRQEKWDRSKWLSDLKAKHAQSIEQKPPAILVPPMQAQDKFSSQYVDIMGDVREWMEHGLNAEEMMERAHVRSVELQADGRARLLAGDRAGAQVSILKGACLGRFVLNARKKFGGADGPEQGEDGGGGELALRR